MASCCRRDYERIFGRGFASSVARRYRRRGLDKTARRMVDFLSERGIDDATVLEIGGGVGGIEIELLRVGAATATNLELSAAYDENARRLAAEAGVVDRINRRVHDIADDAGAIAPADVVIMHRVVCCYGDYVRLLSAAADHAQRALVFSYPPRNALSRVFYGCFNLVMRLMRTAFRGYAHPPAAMMAVLEERGMHRTYEHRSLTWRVAGHERGSESVPGDAGMR